MVHACLKCCWSAVSAMRIRMDGRGMWPSVLHRHHSRRLHFRLAQPEVLACGPVPARTAGLPDGDGTGAGLPVGEGTRVGRPDGDGTAVGRQVRRHRPIAVGSPSACQRHRPAGRRHGASPATIPRHGGAQAGGLLVPFMRATGAERTSA